ncbi:MAG TPA: hypothetical protein PLH62_00240 [Ferruginibacter sp.]|jgi:hypothetical protein|nr:hypothetical protein [Ferruginibacter sp.]HNH22484.1 hypothetical protein [Ferruginibacter sp.]
MKKKRILFVLLILVILASCNTPRYAYSPSAHNVPVLAKKGDSKLGAVYSTNFAGERDIDGETVDERTRGIDVHGAVAISDHFAIQAAYFYRWEKTTGGNDTATIRYNRNLGEFGIGYFIPMTPKKNVIFQLFGGGGIGKFSFRDQSINGFNFHEANITKIYIQPAFIFRSNGSFSSSISLRSSILQFRNIKTSYSYNQLADYNLDSLNNRAKWFFEPAFTGSFGFKGLPGLRIEFQGGLSFLASRKYMDYRIVNFSVGTWIDIGKMVRGDKR